MKALFFNGISGNIEVVMEISNPPLWEIVIPEVKERAIIQKTYKLIAYNDEFAIYQFKEVRITY